jgi:vacuolar-type H+-ATPase catalytic subunit A/Vma1
MLRIIMHFHHAASEALLRNVAIDDIVSLSTREEIGRMRYTGEKELDKLDDLGARALEQVKSLAAEAKDGEG